MTIHTDVGFDEDITAAVLVNDDPIEDVSTFADDRGNLVAKVDFTEVVDIIEITSPEEDEATVALKLTIDGKVSTASETVPVK